MGEKGHESRPAGGPDYMMKAVGWEEGHSGQRPLPMRRLGGMEN